MNLQHQADGLIQGKRNRYDSGGSAIIDPDPLAREQRGINDRVAIDELEGDTQLSAAIRREMTGIANPPVEIDAKHAAIAARGHSRAGDELVDYRLATRT
ncbi:hypothetical protein [Bradyrhizobium sp.]|uniref:hypothetical protein n=1 Tax=Bradyrhizobium sp. TaxID=376 RepID=UPI0025C3D006|nr:hypothetical protein [Bradyrhizobium sp.]